MSTTRNLDIRRESGEHLMSHDRKSHAEKEVDNAVLMDYDGVVHHEFLREENAPDLTPCKFFLFDTLKKTITGKAF